MLAGEGRLLSVRRERAFVVLDGVGNLLRNVLLNVKHPLKSVHCKEDSGYLTLALLHPKIGGDVVDIRVLSGKGFVAVCRLLYLQKVAGSKRAWGLPLSLCHVFNFSLGCFMCSGVRCSLLRFGNGVFADFVHELLLVSAAKVGI